MASKPTSNSTPKSIPPPPVADAVAKSPSITENQYQWLPAVGFLFLTFNSITAVYRSVNDPWLVSFVVISYIDLVLLFWCLRAFERTPPENSRRREKLKAAVWSLTTLITTMFSYKVAAMMPLPVAVIVWGMAAFTTVAGFYAFFIYRDNNNGGNIKL